MAREAIRAEGAALNAKTLAAIKFVQDAFIGIAFSSDVVQHHQGYLDNVIILDTVIDALKKVNSTMTMKPARWTLPGGLTHWLSTATSFSVLRRPLLLFKLPYLGATEQLLSL